MTLTKQIRKVINANVNDAENYIVFHDVYKLKDGTKVSRLKWWRSCVDEDLVKELQRRIDNAIKTDKKIVVAGSKGGRWFWNDQLVIRIYETPEK